MGMKQLESAICAELREVAKNPRIRVKDMLEWSTGPVKGLAGETIIFLPSIQINVAIKKELDKRK